jgi:uncharacterized phiE125 gp8 family phage protein
MSYYGSGWWGDWRRHVRPPQGKVKLVSTVDGPMIPIETLRSQCNVVITDIDSDLIESNPDDNDLLGYLEAAIEHAEDFTGLSIALRTWELALDNFPHSWPPHSWHGCATHDNGIELPRSPFISVESFFAPEGGSSDGEFDLGDDYIVDDFSQPPRLLPVLAWPFMTSSTNAIRIRFRAGYRTESYFDTDYDGAQTLPAAIRQALLLLVGHFFENRENSVEKALSTIPQGFQALLEPKIARIGFA